MYAEYNENSAGLILLELYANGTDAEIIEYDKQEGVNFPSVSGESGASDVIMQYINGGGMAFPTIAVIAPDKRIVENYDAYNSYYDDLSGALKKYNIDMTGIGTDVTDENGFSGISFHAVSSDCFRVNVGESDTYEFALFSVDGKKVNTITNRYYTKGDHTINWNNGTSAGGTYFLRVSGNNRNVIKQFVLVQ